MAQRNSGKRTGNRTATRQAIVDDDDEEDDDDQMSDAELLTQVRAAAGKNNGNAEMAALGYLRDIRKFRRQRNAARERVQELLDEMPEGSLILVGEEASAIRSLLETRKLDPKKLADLIGKLESDLAAEKATNLENAGKLLYSRIAEITGWDKGAVEAVARTGNQIIELKQIEVDGEGTEKGKKVKKDWPHVRPKGDDKAAFTKMDDYVRSSQPYMMAALTQKSSATSGKGQSSGSTTAVVDGTSAPRDGSSEGTNPVQESLERDRKRAEKQADPFAIMKLGVPLAAK